LETPYRRINAVTVLALERNLRSSVSAPLIRWVSCVSEDLTGRHVYTTFYVISSSVIPTSLVRDNPFKLEVCDCVGGVISPLLANLYLHYVFDLWVKQWRRTKARGDVIVVRFADDFVVGFEQREDGERFLSELVERLKRFGLELHAQKTRLIEFGRHAEEDRQSRGEGKPETFNFLGFTHSCAVTRKGRFVVLRQTMRKRWQAKLKEVKAELRRRMHEPVPRMGQYVRSVIVGHMRYYAVPMNAVSVSEFRMAVGRIWWRVLERRSQKAHVSWAQMERRVARWIPQTRVCHPYPWQRFGVIT
jgi:RNA-directed DNA polymerase